MPLENKEQFFQLQLQLRHARRLRPYVVSTHSWRAACYLFETVRVAMETLRRTLSVFSSDDDGGGGNTNRAPL